VSTMLTEIEERIVKVLRERLEAIPPENILLESKPSKKPAVTISNVSFKLEKSGISETQDLSKVEMEERFPVDGVQTTYPLKQKPLKEGLRVECPLGTTLVENVDYSVNLDKGSIIFPTPPLKGTKRILVKYYSQNALTVKSLKVTARYRIEAWGKDRGETDAVAEKVVKALLSVDDELALEGINVTPVMGRTVVEQQGERENRIRLLYVFERELRSEKPVPVMKKVELVDKSPLKA